MADNGLNGKLIGESVQHTLADEQNLWYTPDSGIGIMPLLVQASQVLPPYWSRARDYELARFALKVDHVSSAIAMFVSKCATIPLRVLPRDMSIKAHIKQADDLTANLNELSDWGKGWTSSFAPKMITSLLTQDNGMTAEVIGDGPKDRERQGFYGVRFLDPFCIQRTSNPEYPIIFWDIGLGGTGTRYKMHYTRVMTATDMPSTYSRLNGMGFCAMSRLINTAQHLWDLSTTEQEELGSRPKRRLIIGEQGITLNEIVNAFMQADRQMDNENLSRYSKSVVIASSTKPTDANAIRIAIQDLAPALKGEEKERSITLAMFLIALALKVPPRWLWPATASGATKADAMYQHIAGMGGGVGLILEMFTNMLGGSPLADKLGKPIPPHLQVVFDNQDDEQDRMQAEIREIRGKVWTIGLSDGSLNTRVVRQQMLSAGDITEQQFDDLELNDGRLPDGQDVLNLFYSTDPTIQPMLSISVGDVLNPAANDKEFVLQMIEDKLIEIRATLAAPTRPKEFDAARQAFAALIALKSLYEGAKVTEQTQQDMSQDNPEAADIETEQDKTEPNKPGVKQEEVEKVVV